MVDFQEGVSPLPVLFSSLRDFFKWTLLEIDDSNAEAYIYIAATYYKQDLTAEYEANRDKAKELCGIVAFDRINELIKK